MVPEISCRDLNAWLQSGKPLQLLDVREAHELAICKISPSVHIPLGQLEARWNELDPKMPTVVYCRSGKRSATAVGILAAHGISSQNLVGGVLAWSDEVDSSFQKY